MWVEYAACVIQTKIGFIKATNTVLTVLTRKRKEVETRFDATWTIECAFPKIFELGFAGNRTYLFVHLPRNEASKAGPTCTTKTRKLVS